jgi:hypothetical protein
VNVYSLPQSSYPSFPLKDQDWTLTDLHQVVSKSCVQGLCVAAEKKREEERTKEKTEEVPAVQKKSCC